MYEEERALSLLKRSVLVNGKDSLKRAPEYEVLKGGMTMFFRNGYGDVYETSSQGGFINGYSEEYLDIAQNLKDVKLFSFDNNYDTLLDRGNLLLKEGNKEYLDAEIKENDTNFIFYTSGTSSKPKGVKLSHKSIVSNIEASNEKLKLDSSDVALTMSRIAPLSLSCGENLPRRKKRC